jgi:hypothetical protein
MAIAATTDLARNAELINTISNKTRLAVLENLGHRETFDEALESLTSMRPRKRALPLASSSAA